MIRPDMLLPLLNLISDNGARFQAAVVGGVAAIAHGVYRSTIDLDLLIKMEDDLEKDDLDLIGFRQALNEILTEHKGTIPGLESLGALTLKASPAARPGNTETFKNAIVALIDAKGDHVIDFIGCYFNYDYDAMKDPLPLEGFAPLSVIDFPYLIIMKVQANGPKDRFDIYEIYNKLDGEERLRVIDIAEEYQKNDALTKILKLYDIDITNAVEQIRKERASQSKNEGREDDGEFYKGR